MIDKLKQSWDRWWFGPQSPLDLGVIRILFFGLLLYYFGPRDYAGFGAVPESFIRPVWIFEKLHLPILSVSTLQILEVIWKVCLALAWIGLATRPAAIVAAVLSLYFLGLPFNFGKTDHNMAIVIFLTAILAASRCGDALSLDRLIRRRKHPAPPAPSGEYRWPIRLAWCTMSLIIFAAGATKTIVSGPSWIFSDNFAILLAQRHYGGVAPMVDWGLWIASVKWLCWLFAAGAILTELLFPLALFDRRLRLLLPAAMFGMQIGIGVLMNVWFGPFMYSYLFWVPWTALLAYLPISAGRSAEAQPSPGALAARG